MKGLTRLEHNGEMSNSENEECSEPTTCYVFDDIRSIPLTATPIQLDVLFAC